MANCYNVAVYLVDRAYGGHEEGGWWYETGEIVRTVKVVRNEEAAYAYARRLNERLLGVKNADGTVRRHAGRERTFGPNAGRYDIGSVCSEGEYMAEVHEGYSPMSYPESRPRYE